MIRLLLDSSALWHVLHDANDLTTAARYLPDLRERNIRDTPKTD